MWFLQCTQATGQADSELNMLKFKMTKSVSLVSAAGNLQQGVMAGRKIQGVVSFHDGCDVCKMNSSSKSGTTSNIELASIVKYLPPNARVLPQVH